MSSVTFSKSRGHPPTSGPKRAANHVPSSRVTFDGQMFDSDAGGRVAVVGAGSSIVETMWCQEARSST